MKYVEIHPMMQGIGHVEMQSDGWVITLTESTTDDKDFGISHTGFIRREDDGTFAVEDLKPSNRWADLLLQFCYRCIQNAVGRDGA